MQSMSDDRICYTRIALLLSSTVLCAACSSTPTYPQNDLEQAAATLLPEASDIPEATPVDIAQVNIEQAAASLIPAAEPQQKHNDIEAAAIAYLPEVKPNNNKAQAEAKAKADAIRAASLKKWQLAQEKAKRDRELAAKRAQYHARWAANQARQKQQQATLPIQRASYQSNIDTLRHYPTAAPRARTAVHNAAPRAAYVRPSQPIQQAVVRRTSTQNPPAWQANRAYRLTGDFAKYSYANQFIESMVRKHGFDADHLRRLFSKTKDTGLRVKPLKEIRKKASSRGAWTRYRSYFLTNRHTNAGLAFWKRNRHHLERAERTYGVPAEYIVGIIGVETIYGGNVGKYRAIDALATKTFIPNRRTEFYTKELESYLLMARRERLDPMALKGSTAGALGLPQFMPSNVKKLGVDFDGDGKVNLWTEADAIGSVANYFKHHGWRTGGPVATPARVKGSRYSRLGDGFKHKHSLSTLKSHGVVPENYVGSANLHMVRLKTKKGEDIWAGGHNFYVITRYNHSSYYAMAVHQLGQRIKGKYGGNSRMASSSSRSYSRNNTQGLDMNAVQALLR